MAKLSVIIKTLNEEANIERAIVSSLKAVIPYGGEVIVADSASTDSTVELAMKFPVTVVQLARPNDRCCGVGAQLGYQHSRGEFVYILDGDMELDAAFVDSAMLLMDRDPSLAGIGGQIREMRIQNLELKSRSRRQHRRRSNGQPEVDALAGGGLYRRAAVEDAGYLTDRNLHSFEEYDLGARLRKKGWGLTRLPLHSADHYSYPMTTTQLLWSRMKSGYVLGIGELLRAAVEGRYVRQALIELNAPRLALGIFPYWIVVALLSFWFRSDGLGLVIFSLGVMLPVAAMAIRTRSIALGLYSVLFWNVAAFGLIFGVLRRRTEPTDRIGSRTMQIGEY